MARAAGPERPRDNGEGAAARVRTGSPGVALVSGRRAPRLATSNPALLWLWRRLEATALIRPLAWEPPYASDAALKGEKDQKKKKPFGRGTSVRDEIHYYIFHPYN